MYMTLSLIIRATIVVLGATATANNVAASDESSSRLGHLLSADEVILYNSEGRVEVVPRSESLKYTGGLPVAKAEQRYANFVANADEETNTGNKIEKRCRRQKVFTMKPAETYVNWDVAMSGVIRAPPHSNASINVASGYWIGNSLSVSIPSAVDVVKDFLTTTLGISYGRTWTTTYSAGYTFVIPAGKYGAIVSNPVATRHTGHMDLGCLGNSKRTEFSWESYESKSHSGMAWVDGIIGLCLGDTYPLPRCLGNAATPATKNDPSRIGHILSADEMIHIDSKGRVEVVLRSEYLKYTGGVPIANVEQRYANFTLDTEEEAETQHKIEKRCKKQTVFTMKPTQTYVNWDVPISGVVLAPPNSAVSIGISEGFNIQNSLSSAPSAALNKIKGFMKLVFGVSYGKSWTSSYRSGYTFSVPAGKFGAVVINPLTTRHSGYVDMGCIGQGKRTEFSGESYHSKSNSKMEWVEGLIGLC
ncbi:hypothetical protein EPUL_003606, partial [Erysiphe pulchra]